MSKLSAASRPSGFSQITCLPASRRGDRRLGVQRVRPTVVEEADPVVVDQLAPVAGRVLVAVALARPRATASLFRPAMPTSFGSSGGGHVMYASFLNAFECALPMNA